MTSFFVACFLGLSAMFAWLGLGLAHMPITEWLSHLESLQSNPETLLKQPFDRLAVLPAAGFFFLYAITLPITLKR